MNAAATTLLLPGRVAPLGATVEAGGVNFAVFSQRATRLQLCLFDAEGTRELQRLEMHGPEDGVFHGLLPGARAGLLYGFRAHGPWKPESGHRFNPHKLLLDPCAREIAGRFEWRPEHFGHALGHPEGARVMDTRDNAASALKARVVEAPLPAAARSPRPRRPLSEQVLYETHVKGFTMSLPGIPDGIRGTYAALAHPAAIAHLQRLGVTTLSLLPVCQALDEQALAARGLVNYWGYNTIGFFCADPRLAHRRGPGEPAREFRAMVDTLHAHGLAVVVDMVFNHSAEGDETGPTLSFRGLDNASWYRLVPDDRSRCENFSGCGNTLRVIHPRVTQFVLDALRFWVEVMGVDGFRFDLAPVLGRTRHGFDPSAPFFVALRQDPVLADALLIAEPWDTGHGGYQLGRFPGRFLEWNDRFRDAARGYWLGLGTGRGEFARRFTGSSDLFHHGHRQPTASVNYVAAHDGRPLADVVAYAERHNQANGEGNRDGHGHEACANFGIEGPTDDAAILETRRRVRRALLATALLAQGTPMLCAGDEAGNSQQGNNNAYCQDNPTGWLDWARADEDAIRFTADVLALRREEPLLRHPRWFPGGHGAAGEPSVHWLSPQGGPMQVDDWHAQGDAAFACALSEAGTETPRLCLLFNPGEAPLEFRTPPGPWTRVLDSSGTLARSAAAMDEERIVVPARALLVLRRGDNGPMENS